VRFRSSAVRSTALAVLIACWLSVSPVAAVRAQAEVSESEIASAIEKVKADPNLSQQRKTRTLRWKGDNEPRDTPSGFARWIMNFFGWLGQLSRVLVWVVGGVLAIALIAFVVRMFKNVEMQGQRKADLVPTHVRDLDIRPESLPDDIGAAALALWQNDQHRAALALLYRGLLSRLAHVHQVPIRDSTTEGDCLALASRHLQNERRQYVEQLIRVWQRATYGGREPEANEVQTLCTQFAQSLAAERKASTAA
jgi:Domain of unknown function (DUF4129)